MGGPLWSSAVAGLDICCACGGLVQERVHIGICRSSFFLLPFSGIHPNAVRNRPHYSENASQERNTGKNLSQYVNFGMKWLMATSFQNLHRCPSIYSPFLACCIA